MFTTGKDKVDFQTTGNLPLVISSNKGQRDFEEERFYSPDPFTDPPSTVPDRNAEIAAYIRALRGSGGSSGSSNTLTAAQALDEKLRKQRIAAMQQYLGSGQYANSFAGVRDASNRMFGATEGDIESQYSQALSNIASGYGAAEGLTTQGYSALEQYLAANPNNPYAGFSAAAPTTTNPLESVLSAYGAGMPEAEAMVAAEQSAGASGATNFNSLVDVLSRASTGASQSREAEMQMARNLAMTTLGQQRAGFESQAAGSRQQALAQLARERAQRDAELEQAIAAIRTQIEQEILGAGGTVGGDDGSTGGTAGGGDSSQQSVRAQKIQTAVENNTTLRGAVRDTNPKFFEKNPNPTKAQMEKAFPAVAKAFKESRNK